MLKYKIKTAFTLIELLVVIAIIGILSGLIIVGMSSSIQSASIAKAQIFSASLRDSLLMSLVSEWKFDELSVPVTDGQSIKDSWGKSNGTFSTGDAIDKLIAESNCVYGKCLSFDGIDDIITTPLIYNNLHSFTLEAWIKPTSTGVFEPIIGTALGNNGRSMMQLNNYRLCFNDYDSLVSSTNNVIVLNKWQHTVMVYDNGNIKLYYNGDKAGEGTYVKTDSSEITIIGRISSNNMDRRFNGLIDSVRIYNVAMPSFVIKEDYYSGTNRLLEKGGITFEEYKNKLSSINLAINK